MRAETFDKLILDLGSRSVKAYLKSESIREIAQITWTLLEAPAAGDEAENCLRTLIEPYHARCKEITAVGTEAMRRDARLEKEIRQICARLGINYRQLSQTEEAKLIAKAFHAETRMDVVNSGGGSIQIISAPLHQMTLLPFGISDLNRRFNLARVPEARALNDCVEWISSQLPKSQLPFVYSGGEEKYLRHLGVHIHRGRCESADFRAMTTRLARMEMHDLEKLSPYDPRWMHGAIASNCIVLALLQSTSASFFVPSDLNIAHGLFGSL
jgi:exopolyphosphatase/pppGpp-phosphohydrolase